jgi:hypothetical protein
MTNEDAETVVTATVKMDEDDNQILVSISHGLDNSKPEEAGVLAVALASIVGAVLSTVESSSEEVKQVFADMVADNLSGIALVDIQISNRRSKGKEE